MSERDTEWGVRLLACMPLLLLSVLQSCTCNKKPVVPTNKKREDVYKLVPIQDDEGNRVIRRLMRGNIVQLQHGAHCFMGCRKHYYLYEGANAIGWENQGNRLIVNNETVGLDISRLSQMPSNLPKGTVAVIVCRHCRMLRLSLLEQLDAISADRIVVVLEDFQGTYKELRKLRCFGSKLYGVVFENSREVDLSDVPRLQTLTLLHVLDSSFKRMGNVELEANRLAFLDLKGSSGYGHILCALKGLKTLRYGRLSGEELSPACSGFLRNSTKLRYLEMSDVGKNPKLYLPMRRTLEGFVGHGEHLNNWIPELAEQTGLKMLTLDMGHLPLTCGEGVLGRLSALEELWIGNAGKIGDHCLRGLPEGVERLSLNAEDYNSGLIFLSGLSQLNHLELKGGKIASSGFSRIAELEGLEYLGLHYVRFASSDLGQIRNMRGLRRLWMSGININEDSMRAIGRLSELRELGIVKTGLKDDWLKHLKGLIQLRSVDLYGSGVGDGALSVLGELRHLQKLNLSKTAIEGSRLQKVANWSDLRTLLLNGTSVGGEAIARLSKLPRLRHLEIEYTMAGGRGLCSSKAFPKLRKLYASKLRSKRRDLSCLSRLQGLEVLKLVDGGIDCEMIRRLLSLRRLERLFLMENPVDSECIESLASLPYLTEVWLPSDMSKQTIGKLRHAIQNGAVFCGWSGTCGIESPVDRR